MPAEAPACDTIGFGDGRAAREIGAAAFASIFALDPSTVDVDAVAKLVRGELQAIYAP